MADIRPLLTISIGVVNGRYCARVSDLTDGRGDWRVKGLRSIDDAWAWAASNGAEAIGDIIQHDSSTLHADLAIDNTTDLDEAGEGD